MTKFPVLQSCFEDQLKYILSQPLSNVYFLNNVIYQANSVLPKSLNTVYLMEALFEMFYKHQLI